MGFARLAARLAIALVAWAHCDVSRATQYPTRPVRLIVPFAAGGPSDALARIIGDELAKSLGQPFVIEPKPGAAGVIGSDLVAKAEPDGYTLVLGSIGTHAVNATFYPSLPFDVIRDFTPISLVAQTAHVLLLHPSVPATTLSEFLAHARSNPGRLTYASAGVGSIPHLAAVLLEKAAGISMLHVPYKGGGQAIVDLLAGRVSLMLPTTLLGLPYVSGGELRAVATTGPQRDPTLPATPTVAEAGVVGFEVVSWFGILGPAGLAPEIVDKLAAAIKQVVMSAGVRERLTPLGMTPVSSSPGEFTRILAADIEKWSTVVKTSGAKPE